MVDDLLSDLMKHIRDLVLHHVVCTYIPLEAVEFGFSSVLTFEDGMCSVKLHRLHLHICQILKIWIWELKMVLYVERITAHGVGSYKIPVREFLGHTASVTALAGNGAGIFMSGSEDRTVRVWTFDSLQHVFVGHSAAISALALSPDSRYLLSGGKELILWDLQQLERIHAFPLDARVNALRFDDRTNTAYAGLEDGSLVVVDVNGLQTSIVKKTGKAIADLAILSRDNCLAVAFRGDVISVLDLEGYQELRTLEIDGGSVSLEFSPTIGFLVAASRNGQIYLWDQSWELRKAQIQHALPLRSLSVSPNGSYIIAAGISGKLQFWDSATLSHIRTVSVLNSPINAVQILGSGEIVVAGASGGSLFIYSVDGRLISHFTGQSPVLSVTASKNHVAAGIQSQTIHVWNLNNWEFLEGSVKDVWINSIAFSPDRSLLATGSKDNVLRIWNAKTMGLLHSFVGHRLPVKSVAFSPDGLLLASGSSDKTVRVWNVATKKEVTVLDVPHWVQAVTFSKNGDFLAALLINGDRLYWKLPTFEPIPPQNNVEFDQRSYWESPEFRVTALAETVILETDHPDRFTNPTEWVQTSEFCFSRIS